MLPGSDVLHKLFAPGPRKRAFQSFEDALDTENIPPSVTSVPCKRQKAIASSARVGTTSCHAEIQGSSTSSVTTISPHSENPEVTKNTRRKVLCPVSRVSRANNRSTKAYLISPNLKRRAAGGRFTQVAPPSMPSAICVSGSNLNFSIDAALSGTLSSYKPRPVSPHQDPLALTNLDVPTTMCHVLQDTTFILTDTVAMPKAWIFDIHLDTPEEEMANIMAHNTGVLDISCNDDIHTKRGKEERGKENIPPLNHLDNAQLESSRSGRSVFLHVPKFDEGEVKPQLKNESRNGSGMLNAVIQRVPLAAITAVDYRHDDDRPLEEYVIVDKNGCCRGSSLTKS